MPKSGKGIDQWMVILRQVAYSGKKLGRGEAPPRGSEAGELLARISLCPYLGSGKEPRARRNFFGASKWVSCTCSLHTVKYEPECQGTISADTQDGDAEEPGAKEAHVEACFDEIGRRHDEAGVARPHTIFVDSRCCSGKELGEGAPTKKGPFGARIVLDNFHVLLRLSRTINSECPRKKAVLRDLSRSLYTPFPGDILALNEARAAAGLDPKDEPTRTERGRFIRRRVADPITLENRLMAVVRAHRAVDDEQIAIAQKAGRDISKPLPPTDPAYRVINSTFLSVFRSQLTHVRNCCMSDQPVRGGDHSQPLLPYLPLNRVNYRSSGYYLQQWASLRGTSMVESGHSSIHRLLFGVRGLGRQLFDCRALWWALTWNRRKREKWGLKMPHIGLGPREASLYQELGMADDYPEWQLAPESATEVRFGWDYYNHEITDSLNEAWKTAETASTVDTAADDELSELARFEYERLDFEDGGCGSKDVNVADLPQNIDTDDDWVATGVDATAQSSTSREAVDEELSKIEQYLLGSTVEPDWLTAPLPSPPSPRKRRLRFRMMSGEVPVVPDCEYNEAMTEVWEDIWLHMKPRDTASDLLHRYNVKCHELRRQSPSIPLLALLSEIRTADHISPGIPNFSAASLDLLRTEIGLEGTTYLADSL
ncbi:hypothetical protein FOL46_002501 [Perkinsus olseni]|uniref:Uncharacterized protein n=1 Tax=Perkinsus olseni TaxID=32597 RepID=A0A7J6M8X8_PEROL|nr:hypothetical protein FOL46_002501 [Perkinsus olseni]